MPDQLPWEFHAGLRPWFLPGIFYAFEKLLSEIGITNPFILAAIFRIAAGALGLISSILLYKVTSNWFKSNEERIFLFCLLNFAWFVPFLHVHASSESFAASFFIIGLCIYFLRTEAIWILISGLFMGMSFESRFQSAFLILGFGLWLLIVRKENFKSVLILASGFFIMFATGRFVDFWGYGRPVFSPLNYFVENIVHSVGNQWGTEPFIFTSWK